MLTNIHYFRHYRNYATQNRMRKVPKTADWVTFGRKSENTAALPQETSVLLNAAYKNETITYARNLSRNVVGLKDSAKMFVYDAMGHGYNDNFWHWIEEDIENFVSAYNGLRKIAKNTGHSALLTNFTARMDSHARLNRALILKLGVKINRQRELVFGGTVPANLRNQDMRSSLEPIADFFKSSYKSATGLLKHPLAEHMNFRSLDFYYNYRFGPAGENTLIQMERGVLVDVAV